MSNEVSVLRNKIKKGLLEQLNIDGVSGDHFVDLVDKYLIMWDMAQALEDDFKSNGAKTMTSTGLKINPSIPEYAKTNNQMLRLISELGLKPVRQVADEDDPY